MFLSFAFILEVSGWKQLRIVPVKVLPCRSLPAFLHSYFPNLGSELCCYLFRQWHSQVDIGCIYIFFIYEVIAAINIRNCISVLDTIIACIIIRSHHAAFKPASNFTSFFTGCVIHPCAIHIDILQQKPGQCICFVYCTAGCIGNMSLP